MKLLILASALFLISEAYKFPDECSRGPNYWCQNLETAVKCSAVRHCQQTVWFGKKHENPTPASTEETKPFCHGISVASKKLFEQGIRQTNLIQNILRKTCNQMAETTHSIRTCQTAVDIYVQDILEHIQSDIGSDNICSKIFDSHKIAKRQSTNDESISLRSPQCTFCKFLIGYIDAEVGNNRTVPAIEAQLEKVCNVLPASLRPNCTHIVQTYGPIIAILLASNATPIEVCDKIKLCNNGTAAASSCVSNTSPTNSGDLNIPRCSVCKFMLKYAELFVLLPKAESDGKLALLSGCHMLPAPISNECDRLVDSYGSSLLGNLQKVRSGELDCSSLGLC